MNIFSKLFGKKQIVEKKTLNTLNFDFSTIDTRCNPAFANATMHIPNLVFIKEFNNKIIYVTNNFPEKLINIEKDLENINYKKFLTEEEYTNEVLSGYVLYDKNLGRYKWRDEIKYEQRINKINRVKEIL